MKQSIKLFPQILFAVALCFAGCKKDKEEPPSLEDILTKTACWRKTAVEDFNPTTNTWVDVTATSLVSCELDNCISFNTGNFIWINEGISKCDPNAPQNFIGGTWTVTSNSNNNTFAITESGEVYSGTIIQLDYDKFVWEISETGFRSRITFTN